MKRHEMIVNFVVVCVFVVAVVSGLRKTFILLNIRIDCRSLMSAFDLRTTTTTRTASATRKTSHNKEKNGKE